MSQRFRILDPCMVKMRNVGGELVAAVMSQVIIKNILGKGCLDEYAGCYV